MQFDESALSDTISEITNRFESTNEARDSALQDGRLVVRKSANAIRALHRNQLDEAQKLLGEAKSLFQSTEARIAEYPMLRYAGYVQDPMKEFAEASILYSIISEESLPSPESLGIDDAPFLNGLAEAASELRRRILDELRRGNYEQAELFLDSMDGVYSLLVTVDFPDGITGGLRRTTDQLRAVLERTRGDLTVTSAQQELKNSLDATLEALEKDRY